MNVTAQKQFEDFRTARPVRCVSRNGANERLGTVKHELDAILSRPLNHKLRLTGVLDLAGPGAEQEHLCFVVQCLEEFRAGQMVKRSDDQLAVLIFGELQKENGVVAVKRIYRALNCKHDHIYQFTAGRRPALPLAAGSVQRCGPGGSAMVRWSDLVKFLSERRLA